MRNLLRAWLVLAAALAGCAAAEPEPTPTPVGGTTIAGEGGTADEATATLRVGLTEWTVETGERDLLPGDVAVVVTNAGAMEHDVVVHGSHGTWRTPVLGPGERHEMTIRTAPGEQLQLVCTVVGHEAAGMRTELSVVDGPAP